MYSVRTFIMNVHNQIQSDMMRRMYQSSLGRKSRKSFWKNAATTPAAKIFQQTSLRLLTIDSRQGSKAFFEVAQRIVQSVEEYHGEETASA